MVLVYYYVRDFFLFIGQIIVGFFSLIWNLILVLIKCVTFLTSLIAHVPLVLSIPLGAVIVIAVLYKVLGREKGAG